jgi:hypothetical protein
MAGRAFTLAFMNRAVYTERKTAMYTSSRIALVAGFRKFPALRAAEHKARVAYILGYKIPRKEIDRLST